jgi:hypothetical protein
MEAGSWQRAKGRASPRTAGSFFAGELEQINDGNCAFPKRSVQWFELAPLEALIED